tara:strand:+ start:7900 stop:8769 length:870 start_codon:yes stop_codon:yes gene_type:complete
MTGFARVEGGDDSLTWIWEARSVNGKGLDIRCRLPHGLDQLEPVVRETAGKHMGRGNVQFSLNLGRGESEQGLTINQAAFVRVAALARELQELDGINPPSLDGLLRLPGVLETGSQGMDDLSEENLAAIRADTEALCSALAAARAEEGARLLGLLNTLVTEITGHVEAASQSAGAQPALIRERLETQIAELTQGKVPVTEEKLAQEITLLATRADVREEIDRLRTHIAAVRDLLSGGDAPGRRLGFLCQELLREANTLCSKSSDTGLTAIGLDLKVAIDRLREQALNVE